MQKNLTPNMTRRVAREKDTVSKMITLYCHARHGSYGALCTDCAALRDYALDRIDRCMFQPDKPACGRCPVHCYQPEMRARIREVMRYAGPRMLFRHPIAAAHHLAHTISKPSEKVRRVAEIRLSRE